MFFLNRKKAKEMQPESPRWFTMLMIGFFAFIVFRAVNPSDAPENAEAGAPGERLLNEMPSLKRVVTGEQYERVTAIMEDQETSERAEDVVESKAEHIFESLETKDAPQQIPGSRTDIAPITEPSGDQRFKVNARNGKGEPVEVIVESDGVDFEQSATHTIVIPPKEGRELLVIELKRIDE